MNPSVSAIVLNYRSPKDTLTCVRALLRQTMADELEIIVVDNHSDDESIGVFRAAWKDEPRVRVVECGRNVGYARGNAVGMRAARGRYVLFINPDNTPPETAVRDLADILQGHPDIGIVAPALLYPDGTVRPSARSFPTVLELFMKRIAAKTWHERHKNTPVSGGMSAMQDVDWVAGACLMIEKSFFEQLGGFDGRFFLFFEDIDLCRRVWQAGKRVVYAPGIHVSDKPRRLSEGGILSLLWKKTGRIHLRSGIRYFRKWPRAQEERRKALTGS